MTFLLRSLPRTQALAADLAKVDKHLAIASDPLSELSGEISRRVDSRLEEYTVTLDPVFAAKFRATCIEFLQAQRTAIVAELAELGVQVSQEEPSP